MMDTLTFENDAGKVFRLTDYGLFLKYFDAPEPEPKTYIESIEGADGDLDLTEWAGVIRYENRPVTFGIRDMNDTWWREFAAFANGKNLKITHSDDPEHYYYGRCTLKHQTRKRVTDVEVQASCNPYRLQHRETVVAVDVTNSATVTLEALARPVTPRITVDAEINIEYDGTGITLLPGTHTVYDLLLTTTPKTVAIHGNGKITFAWRDGVM